jgi:hypothetical protein
MSWRDFKPEAIAEAVHFFLSNERPDSPFFRAEPGPAQGEAYVPLEKKRSRKK